MLLAILARIHIRRPAPSNPELRPSGDLSRVKRAGPGHTPLSPSRMFPEEPMSRRARLRRRREAIIDAT